MKKYEVWKDRTGGLWQVVVTDDAGGFPLGAKSLSPDRPGFHLFTKDGKYQEQGESMFDLAAPVAAPSASCDDLLVAACHAMQGLLAGKSAAPVDAIVDQSIDYATRLISGLRARK